jgi:hypothetical protein
MNCKICGLPITLKSWYKYNGILKTCSKICKDKLIGLSNSGKQRSEEIKQNLRGENNPRFGKPAWNRKEHNYLPYFCDCGCLEICNHGKRYVSGHNFQGRNIENNPWKFYKNRHKNGNPGAEKSKELWTDREWRNIQVKKIFDASHIRPNFKEKFLDSIIQLVRPSEFQYVGDGKVIIEGKCPDWINVNGKKQIIEFFGKRWHKPEDEEIRSIYFAKYGYETLVVWESEIKDLDILKEKIRSFA